MVVAALGLCLGICLGRWRVVVVAAELLLCLVAPIVGVVVLLVPLMASTWRTLQYRNWQETAQASAETWLEGTAWRVHSAQLAHQDIVITVVGPGASPPEEELIAAMRREVPEDVTIRIVEVSGQTTEY